MRREHQLDPAEARRIKEMRIARRMTQNDLALATGLSESAIQKMESLRMPITPRHHSAIEGALEGAAQPREKMAVS
jgi:transcriptional regulator with XRE-family HTH domain